MRNILMFVLIFVPLLIGILVVYTKMFKKHALPPEAPKPPTRHDELLKLRAELNQKLTELSDEKEIRDLRYRLNEVERQITSSGL